MLAKIYSAAVYGVDAYEVEIEVNVGGGTPNIIIVGLPDTAVKESRDRVTTAITNPKAAFMPWWKRLPVWSEVNQGARNGGPDYSVHPA